MTIRDAEGESWGTSLLGLACILAICAIAFIVLVALAP